MALLSDRTSLSPSTERASSAGHTTPVNVPTGQAALSAHQQPGSFAEVDSRSTGIGRLPAELIQAIGSELPADEVVGLSQTASHIRGALGDDRLGALWQTRVGRVTSLAGVQRFLQESQADLLGSPRLQAKAMTALAGRIALLPKEQRLTAIAGILAVSVNLPPAFRGGTLTVLADSVATDCTPLCKDGIVTLFTLFGEHAALPHREQGLLLAALARNVETIPNRVHIPAEGQTGLFANYTSAPLPTEKGRAALAAWQNVFDAIADLPPEHRPQGLTALAGSVGGLPSRQRATAFDRLLEASAALSPEHAGALLTAIADNISDFHRHSPGHWLSAQNALFEACGSLPHEQQGPLLAALARSIGKMPASHAIPQDRQHGLFAHFRVTLQPGQPGRAAFVAWQNIFAAVTALPPEHRAPALAALSGSIAQLPQDEQKDVFATLLETLTALQGALNQEPLPRHSLAPQRP
jgi:hypothetical protein